MARPRSFDESEVLDRVTQTFWERGYANTSIADLEAASGLGRQSLYSAFGDKHQLFLRSLERYGSMQRGQGASAGAPPSAPPFATIEAMLRASVDFFSSGNAPNSCLVVQAMLEFGDSDAMVAGKCRESTDAVKARVQGLVAEAAATSGLADGVDVDTATTMIMAQYFAIPIMARAGTPAPQLRTSISTLLQRLSR